MSAESNGSRTSCRASFNRSARVASLAALLAAGTLAGAPSAAKAAFFPCNTGGGGILHNFPIGVADNYATGNTESTPRSGKLSTQISKWTSSGELKSATSVVHDADNGLGITAVPGSSNRILYAYTYFVPPSVFANGRMISAAELEIKLKPRGAPMYANAGVPGSHNDIIRMVGFYGSSQFPSIIPNSDQKTFVGQDSPPWNVFAQVDGKTIYITLDHTLWITSEREFNVLVYYYSMVDYAILRICTMP